MPWADETPPAAPTSPSSVQPTFPRSRVLPCRGAMLLGYGDTWPLAAGGRASACRRERSWCDPPRASGLVDRRNGREGMPTRCQAARPTAQRRQRCVSTSWRVVRGPWQVWQRLSRMMMWCARHACVAGFSACFVHPSQTHFPKVIWRPSRGRRPVPPSRIGHAGVAMRMPWSPAGRSTAFRRPAAPEPEKYSPPAAGLVPRDAVRRRVGPSSRRGTGST